MWLDNWTPHVLETADTDRIQPLPPEAAQPLVNFAIYRPRTVPADVGILGGSVRLEAPPGEVGERGERPPDWTSANTCSYLTVYQGGGRRFRLKQFLYDWAPPAADQPPLWASETRALPATPPFVVWIGTDFQGRQGAFSRLNRTTIELSVAEGRLDDAEIVALYASMEAADPQRARTVEARRFADLTYWSRHDVPVVDVPYGLWVFGRSDEAERAVWSSRMPADLPFPVPRPPAGLGFEFDSIGRFGPTDAPELEVIYTAPPGRGREIRFVVQAGDRGRIANPPQRSSHPGRDQPIDWRGGTAQLAWIDERYGPWELVAEAGDIRFMMLCSTATSHDRAWLDAVLDGLAIEGGPA